MKQTLKILILVTVALLSAQPVLAEVVAGQISDWYDSDQIEIGDGDNHVTLLWSVGGPHDGYLYGSDLTGDSDIAIAEDVTVISQIADASAFSFISDSVECNDAVADENGVGGFFISRNNSTGHYAVLHVEEIIADMDDPFNSTLAGTWWFLTDGSGDFSAITPTANSTWSIVKTMY